MNDRQYSEWMKSYLGEFPNDFLSWVEGFADILEADRPDPNVCVDSNEFFKRLGAWETQEVIRKKLLYACKVERERLANKKDIL